MKAKSGREQKKKISLLTRGGAFVEFTRQVLYLSSVSWFRFSISRKRLAIQWNAFRSPISQSKLPKGAKVNHKFRTLLQAFTLVNRTTQAKHTHKAYIPWSANLITLLMGHQMSIKARSAAKREIHHVAFPWLLLGVHHDISVAAYCNCIAAGTTRGHRQLEAIEGENRIARTREAKSKRYDDPQTSNL